MSHVGKPADPAAVAVPIRKLCEAYRDSSSPCCRSRQRRWDVSAVRVSGAPDVNSKRGRAAVPGADCSIQVFIARTGQSLLRVEPIARRQPRRNGSVLERLITTSKLSASRMFGWKVISFRERWHSGSNEELHVNSLQREIQKMPR